MTMNNVIIWFPGVDNYRWNCFWYWMMLSIIPTPEMLTLNKWYIIIMLTLHSYLN